MPFSENSNQLKNKQYAFVDGRTIPMWRKFSTIDNSVETWIKLENSKTTMKWLAIGCMNFDGRLKMQNMMNTEQMSEHTWHGNRMINFVCRLYATVASLVFSLMNTVLFMNFVCLYMLKRNRSSDEYRKSVTRKSRGKSNYWHNCNFH